MKRFGSVFPFVEAGRQARHMGRLVANYEFVRALLTYGTFDEYVFSNPSTTNLRTFERMLSEWLPDDRRAHITCLGYNDLPGALRSGSFDVFHLGGWGAFMPGLHYLRARYASNPWPITAVIHSLNGRNVVDDAVRVSHAGLSPCDAIFCTSEDGREAMRRLLERGAAISGRGFEGRLEHLPLGIDDTLVEARGDRERARTRLRIGSDAVVLLVLGRMTPTQKMDLAPLLRTLALQVVPRSASPVCLLLAGGAAPDELKLVTEAITRYGLEPHVRLYANFPIEQKADVLAASDMLVSPVDNAQETFGLSLLEGMAAGLPVVASRFDGYKDLVEDGVDGFLVDTRRAPLDPMAEWFDLLDPNVAQLYHAQGVVIDLDQLATRLLQLIGDAGMRRAMGEAGRDKVRRHYRWSRVIARYEETWARLSAEAMRIGVPATREPAHPYNLAPDELFSHYCSAALHPDDRVIARPGVPGDAPYSDTSPLLRPALLRSLLQRAQNGTTCRALLSDATASESECWAAISWLLKYGLLTLA